MHHVSADPSKLEIQLHPAAILRQRAEPVDEITEEVRGIARRMVELMIEAEGIGLAAPQVGVSKRMFVTRLPEDRAADEGMVFIDPEIEVLDETPVEDVEGCLSLPGIDVLVRRPVGVRISATDLDGTPFVLELDNHFARVFQHEFDHLEGVLIIDRMNTMERLRNRKALRALERA